MIVLGVDSSSSTATCALISEKGVLGEINLNDKKQHSVLIMDMIDRLLKDCNLTIKDIDGFAISEGPGSFTGLRIGMATLKGLSFGTNKPCVSISSLKGLAYNVINFTGIICPIIDALRNNVYTCLYKFENGELISLTDSDCLSLDELIELLQEKDEPIMFLGDGVQKHKQTLSEKVRNTYFAPITSNYPKASSICSLALPLLQEGFFNDLNTMAPIYLRKSQAEREYEQRMGL
ncbi:tRNA (adenosine(37)-N6)-threonylcarbamoyltransferase complex dimerization subunit type 1 TsaB [Clostridium tarantellae]|uniref:tRNA (Adenosine(37)-N6)-threonylcarbamoyltransferase complex dimerization subunit type 1 TsaB n=1 Tax=Clostridium tarantellae TaxID=39493 RepID=A0A6I1MKM0_9CLOT|nr:tRNA (adenosine(37)-N6)-threonylcarbamoyltransferase complex dimerization subunit type 1 TsaB [Clostridium tarantellae]MPQ43560.1 tRNA (adenosine(37)-N6)-threonylcarbamoyltransferase complex dimerization subunit type 1 TsaB [Clostridium tarantellae]